uniref:Hyp2 n=1 Tax=Moniliophthora roreri (strain MCA 2997) TaxID=1381753 RepID=F2WVI2_MONRO|nr:hyp2 [Moniliophthora roreri]ADO51585.1 hyp2 [Moniliophthora roreri]
MLFLLFLIIFKSFINDKLSYDLYHRISAIILLFTELLSYNGIYNLDSISGIGIYSGLFIIKKHSQILENITFIKVLSLYIIVGFIYLIYLFIELYIFILFIRGKIKIPYYLPPFLSEWLSHIEEDRKFNPDVVRAFMDLRLRNIIIHIVSLLLLIIFYTYS